MVRFIFRLILCCGLISLAACERKSPRLKTYPTVSYLKIKLDEHGNLPSNPYIHSFEKGRKKVVFCGTNHLLDASDVTNSMFQSIEQAFFKHHPSVAINEGGDVSKMKYLDKYDAIRRDGEIGLTKVLADSLHIATVNGDPTAAYEFRELAKYYSKGEIVAYIVTERLLWGLKGQGITKNTAVMPFYQPFVSKYLMEAGGVQLNTYEQSFEFFKSNYEALLHRPFQVIGLEPTNPFKVNSRFQEIGYSPNQVHLLV